MSAPLLRLAPLLLALTLPAAAATAPKKGSAPLHPAVQGQHREPVIDELLALHEAAVPFLATGTATRNDVLELSSWLEALFQRCNTGKSPAKQPVPRSAVVKKACLDSTTWDQLALRERFVFLSISRVTGRILLLLKLMNLE